jgi:FkbM family methyltransferase
MELFDVFKTITNHPLNQGRTINAILGFIRWQIASRLLDRPVAVNFVNATRLLVSKGMTGATGNIYTGLHEFEDMAFIMHFLRAGDSFVDVGANIGSYTVLASGAVGAKCISIEPVQKTFLHLMDNINLNAINRKVEALNIGVGNENGVLKFTSEMDTVNHVMSDSDEGIESIDVMVRTLDDILEKFEPLLIKIDVEGFETNVIAGAKKTLSNQTLLGVVMELNGSGNRYGFDEDFLHGVMLDYGFNAFLYDPFNRRLLPINGKNNKSGNTLYIRDADAVNSRLESAPKFSTSNGWTI